MANEETLQKVRLQSNFYRDGYRRILAALLIMVLINVVLGVSLLYVVRNKPTPEYFATTSDGNIIKIYSLSAPVVSTSELLQWATVAATTANTYNFVNYRQELEKASAYFTSNGWKEFQDALRSSNVIETVVDRKLTVSAVAQGAPVVLDQGVIGGSYKWKVQLPILLTAESASGQNTQASLVTMLITRVPTLDTPRGIAIDAFYMSGGLIR